MIDYNGRRESRIGLKAEKDKYFDYSVQWMRWLLQSLGAWPLETPFYPKLLRILLRSVSFFFIAFIMTPLALFTFVIVKDYKIRLKLAGPLTYCLMNTLKYCLIMKKNDELRESLQWMSNDWQTSNSDEERALMKDIARKARNFTVFCVVFMHISSMSFSIILPYTQDKIVVHNVSMRILSYPSYYVFFDPYIMPRRDIIYLMQNIGCFVCSTVSVTVCSTVIACTLHICGQISVTSWMLQNFSPSFEKQAFRVIIQKHTRLLDFARKLEKLLNGMCAVEMAQRTFNICMLAYLFITEYDPNNKTVPYIYSNVMMSNTFSIFVFCYIGDLLTHQCDSIGKIAYSVEWNKMSGKEARDFVMMIALTQKPIQLTAGKMATLSLQNFTNVMKASFSYLNVLRSMTVNTS